MKYLFPSPHFQSMCVLLGCAVEDLLSVSEPWQQLLFYVTRQRAEHTQISIRPTLHERMWGKLAVCACVSVFVHERVCFCMCVCVFELVCLSGLHAEDI